MAKKKTCFVVSPIGDEGSDIRGQADDLYELVIGPALEPFDFDLVRADRIPGSGVITTEIIELVQNAELCVIDLSGHNANVYYECGRRHETGKPYVQLIRRGETIPFDLAGIRTILYDFATPRGVYEAAQALRRFVDEHVQSGFQPPQTGASMATLATGLERIERKVDRLADTSTRVARDLPSSTGSAQEQYSKDPRLAVAEALAVKNFEYAASLLPAAARRSRSVTECLSAAAVLASEGFAVGAETLCQILDGPLEGLELEELQFAVGSYVTYLHFTDTEKERLPFVRDVTGRILEQLTLDPCTEAYFLNQLQRAMPASAGETPEDALVKEALALSLRATELCPEDPAYWYNLSMNYERRGLDDLALGAVDRYMSIETDQLTVAQLFQAVDVYVRGKRQDDARRAFHRLQAVSPPRAQLMLSNPEVASIVAE